MRGSSNLATPAKEARVEFKRCADPTRFADGRTAYGRVSYGSVLSSSGTCSEPLTSSFPQWQNAWPKTHKGVSGSCLWLFSFCYTWELNFTSCTAPWACWFRGQESSASFKRTQQWSQWTGSWTDDVVIGAPFDSGENREDRTVPNRLGWLILHRKGKRTAAIQWMGERSLSGHK